MQTKKKNLENLLFTILLVIFYLIIFFSLLQNKNIYNQVNNRTSLNIQFPTVSKFLKGDYQEQFEQAISDQMPKYNYFQLFYPTLSNLINYNTLKIFNLDRQQKYIKLGENIYAYDTSLVYPPIQEKDLKDYEEDIQKINTLKSNTNKNIYFYYINSDYNINFETNKKLQLEKYFQKHLTLSKDHIKMFTVNDFQDYQQYFYRLDHHWNNIGSRMAYLDIASMMHLSSTLKVKNESCFQDKKFLGSKSKMIALHHFLTEKICVDTYDFPKFTIYSQGKVLDDYGNDIEKLKNQKELSYATIYGGDYDEIIFKNEDAKENKNLLIYSNSYSNSLNKLLASHYRNTYVIDGRYIKDFNFINYLEEKQIDDVLILANNMLFKDTTEWGNL